MLRNLAGIFDESLDDGRLNFKLWRMRLNLWWEAAGDGALMKMEMNFYGSCKNCGRTAFLRTFSKTSKLCGIFKGNSANPELDRNYPEF